MSFWAPMFVYGYLEILSHPRLLPWRVSREQPCLEWLICDARVALPTAQAHRPSRRACLYSASAVSFLALKHPPAGADADSVLQAGSIPDYPSQKVLCW